MLIGKSRRLLNHELSNLLPPPEHVCSLTTVTQRKMFFETIRKNCDRMGNSLTKIQKAWNLLVGNRNSAEEPENRAGDLNEVTIEEGRGTSPIVLSSCETQTDLSMYHLHYMENLLRDATFSKEDSSAYHGKVKQRFEPKAWVLQAFRSYDGSLGRYAINYQVETISTEGEPSKSTNDELPEAGTIEDVSSTYSVISADYVE
ncbi:unnamed protein product [Auanema sp. JU1783]|nr:unnamed protein product [Auanema sp. JU1783]